MKKLLTFKIDGEWLTGFVQQRYWHEGLSYSDAFKLLEAVLLPYGETADESLAEVINGVLTGIKKLVGVNEFSVKPDDKFKEYSKYLHKEVLDNGPESQKKERYVKVKVFDGDKHSLPFTFYDGTSEEYLAVPDPDFTSKMGLLDPDGNYYGCTFASHLFLAKHLISRNPSLRRGFELKYGKLVLSEDRSLDFLLLDRGWVALRNPFGGEPRLDLGNYVSEEELPQKMLDTLYDYRISLRNRN